MNKEIKYIKTEELYPHPDNPRKDIGDVTELADSIKASGILQNLTVIKGHRQTAQEYISSAADEGRSAAYALVEWSKNTEKKWLDGGYTVIIGHRRLAAAKAAGLSELPCVICEMPYNEQISTMLCENMQRRDLTIIEEVDGIQLMLDLGETVESISEKTGLSKTTVYRRRNMAALDREKLRESLERGPKLEDYAELEKIKDSSARDEVLKTIGTPSFGYYLNRAIQNQEREADMKAARERLSERAKEITRTDVTSDMKYLGYSAFKNIEEKLAGISADEPIFFIMGEYGAELYGKKSAEETAEEDERIKEVSAKRERKEKLSAAFENIYYLRKKFIKNFIPSAAKGRAIDEGVLRYLCREAMSEKLFSDISGILPNEDGGIDCEDIINGKFNYPMKKAVLVALYASMDGKQSDCLDWNGNYEESDSLEMIYELLEGLGYETSDEERALLNGTHELYGGSEDEN